MSQHTRRQTKREATWSEVGEIQFTERQKPQQGGWQVTEKLKRAKIAQKGVRMFPRSWRGAGM